MTNKEAQRFKEKSTGRLVRTWLHRPLGSFPAKLISEAQMLYLRYYLRPLLPPVLYLCMWLELTPHHPDRNSTHCWCVQENKTKRAHKVPGECPTLTGDRCVTPRSDLSIALSHCFSIPLLSPSLHSILPSPILGQFNSFPVLLLTDLAFLSEASGPSDLQTTEGCIYPSLQ